MHRVLRFSQDPATLLWNALAHVLAASEEDLSTLVGNAQDRKGPGPLLVGDVLAGKAGEFRVVGSNAAESSSECKILLNGGNVLFQPLAGFLHLLTTVP